MKSKNYRFKDNQMLADSGYKVKGKQGTKRNVLSVCKSLIFPAVDYALEPGMMLSPLGKILMNTNPATKG